MELLVLNLECCSISEYDQLAINSQQTYCLLNIGLAKLIQKLNDTNLEIYGRSCNSFAKGLEEER